MVVTRRRTYRRRPVGRRRVARRRALRRPAPMRPLSLATQVKWFSESMYAGTVSSNSGGIFQVRFNDIPQAPSYAKLWTQFCIKKLMVTLVPYLGGVDANQALANVAGSIPTRFTGRLLTSIMSSPQETIPTSEVDLLIDNGVKIHVNSSGKPVRLVCYPKPELEAVDTGLLTNTYIGLRTKGLQWMNTSNAAVTRDGQDVLHNGIRWWLNVPTTPPSAVVAYYDVYYKITFGMRSPA